MQTVATALSKCIRRWLTLRIHVDAGGHAGHYILAYILARRAFVPPYEEQVRLDKKAQQTQGFVELLAIAVLAGVYNYVLLVYGLEY
jgi:hypothetical protein